MFCRLKIHTSSGAIAEVPEHQADMGARAVFGSSGELFPLKLIRESLLY